MPAEGVNWNLTEGKKNNEQILFEKAWKKAQDMNEKRPFTDADTLRGNMPKGTPSRCRKNTKASEQQITVQSIDSHK